MMALHRPAEGEVSNPSIPDGALAQLAPLVYAKSFWTISIAFHMLRRNQHCATFVSWLSSRRNPPP